MCLGFFFGNFSLVVDYLLFTNKLHTPVACSVIGSFKNKTHLTVSGSMVPVMVRP